MIRFLLTSLILLYTQFRTCITFVDPHTVNAVAPLLRRRRFFSAALDLGESTSQMWNISCYWYDISCFISVRAKYVLYRKWTSSF